MQLNKFLFEEEATHVRRLPKADADDEDYLNNCPPEHARVQNLGDLTKAFFSISLTICLKMGFLLKHTWKSCSFVIWES